MDQEKLADALNGLTRRDLERLRAQIDKQLVVCLVCGAEGAVAYRVMRSRQSTGNASLMLCMPCFEKHRLPESRVE